MSDNPNLKELDGKRINIHQEHEVIYWCKALKCTHGQLMLAIAIVGTSVAAVRKYLGK